MKVIICRSNPIDPDPRVEKEARALAGEGYEVQVVAWDRTASLPEDQEKEGYTVRRLAIQASYAQGLANLVPLLRWLWGLSLWLWRGRKDYQIVHACDFDTILPALLMKGFFGKLVIYDIFDFYADHLRKTPRWMKYLIRRVDYWVVGRADGVIIVDPAREEQVISGSPRRLRVIYNSPEDFSGEITSEVENIQRFKLVYVGLLQEERGLFELLEVIREHPQWELHLAGFGGDQESIQAEAESLDNVKFYGRIPYRQTLQMTANCDVSIATYDPTIKNHRYSSPNKIFESMMLSKPVIVARATNMDDIIEQWKCGLVVKYGAVDELESALMKLAESPDLRKRLGRNGREAYQKRYAWNKMKTRLLDLYQEIKFSGE